MCYQVMNEDILTTDAICPTLKVTTAFLAQTDSYQIGFMYKFCYKQTI